MPRRSNGRKAAAAVQLPCLEAADVSSPGSLAKKLQEALLSAKLEDFQREGIKALPLSASSCVMEIHEEVQTAFTVVDIATNYDFSNLASLEVDETNAQQFVEQLGPGRRPLWAVPVILRPKNAGLVLVFTCVFRESGSVRSHLAKSSALKELKHWTLRNSQNLQVTFLSVADGQQMVMGGPTVAIQQMPKAAAKSVVAQGVQRAEGASQAAERAERELLEAEAKEAAKKARAARPVVRQTVPGATEVATSPGDSDTASTSSKTPVHFDTDDEADGYASILQLLTGWMGSVRAEESCQKVVNANYWHYRRNENACWRLSHLPSASSLWHALASGSSCVRCADRLGCLCSCIPNPWLPLPELEPDGREPQLLLATAAPPGLEPHVCDTSLWRHLLRGTHGFSLQGPQPVSLFPEAPDLARTARVRQRNAGWRRWWISWRKSQVASMEPVAEVTAPVVLMPVPAHLCWKVQRYIEELQQEEWTCSS